MNLPTGIKGLRITRWVYVIAALQGGLLLVTSTRYGYHGDEMYFIASGAHPAFGYPDQPPLVPLISWFLNELAPRSLLILRLPADIAAGTITLISAAIVRQLGGTRRAQLVAASCTAISGFELAAAHLFHTTTFDMLSTALTCWLIIRALINRSGITLLLAGLVAGVGSEGKTQVLFVAAALLIAAAVVGPRWPFRTWWLASAVAVAAVIAAPYFIWQMEHGWPQISVASSVSGTEENGRAGFIPYQLLMVSPFLVPVWISGLVWPWRCTGIKDLRCVSVAFGLLAIAYMLANGKAYYLASTYPMLIALGAIPVANWTMRGRTFVRLAAFDTAVVLGALINIPIALPLTPVTSLQGSAAMTLNPDQGGTVGWPAFVNTVSDTWQALAPITRQHTIIFTGNYSEASAIDLLGKPLHLPNAYSGHNGYSEWGHPKDQATMALITGFDNPSELSPNFDDCVQLATVNNHVGLQTDEQGLPVLLCRRTASWPQLWPALRHFD